MNAPHHPQPRHAGSSYSCGFCADQGCVLCLTTPQHQEHDMPHENILGAFVHAPQPDPSRQAVHDLLGVGRRVVLTLLLADVGAHYRHTQAMLHELAAGCWRGLDADSGITYWNVVLDAPERRLVLLLDQDTEQDVERAVKLLLRVGNAAGVITVESASEGA